MDPAEIRRLMLLIQARGHKPAYLPKTREELDARGYRGYGEAALGLVEVVPYDGKDDEAVLMCVVILPGEMLTLPDNKTKLCDWGCGRTIQHRPWVDTKIPKVCLYCISERNPEDN